ncbi:MAG: MarR family winged helix-turn-helix transcriptional regulator [Novosphingobium sp.]
MKDPLLDLPGYSLRRAANAVMGEFVTRLDPLGLRLSDVSILLLIEANPGITASQIGRMLDIQRANMVPLIGRIEKTGLVSRAPIDGKSHGLRLTDAGSATLRQARTVIEKFEDDLIGRVPEPHRPHFKPALDALWRG